MTKTQQITLSSNRYYRQGLKKHNNIVQNNMERSKEQSQFFQKESKLGYITKIFGQKRSIDQRINSFIDFVSQPLIRLSKMVSYI